MQNEESPNQHEQEEEGELLQKAYEFIPNGLCQYKQRGPYLVCTSCELQHAQYIGMDRIMVGEDEDGKPILKERSKV
jgi:hypothetical protein